MSKTQNSNMHDFKVNSIDGKEVDLSIYKDQLCLVVNVASA